MKPAMRRIRITAIALALGLLTVACTSGGSGSPGAPGPGGAPDPTGSGEGTDGADADEPDVPHALGTILLGETHMAGESQAYPLVSISFVPDAAKVKACRETLGGCEILSLPKCTETESFTGCGDGESCVLDDTCKPACIKNPRCTETCKDDEVCVATNESSGAGECRVPASFDAGPIAFSGTTMPLTLYPPYTPELDSDGAPFLGGDELRVKAQGAVDRGFEAFDETFTATTFIQSKPALDKIGREVVFGSGALPVSWVAGSDTIVITISGAGGSARCKASDASGKFDVPRAVIDRVRGDDELARGSALALSIARVRTETKKDKKTKGKDAQPTGWLDLTTTSIETTSFQGCSSGTPCGEGCVDLTSDSDNCGACGTKCSAGQECTNGKCGAVTCVAGPESTLARCSDGCSNDGDPYIDCDDYDCCPVRTDCPPTTACGKQ
jgi:hypothetical protein